MILFHRKLPSDFCQRMPAFWRKYSVLSKSAFEKLIHEGYWPPVHAKAGNWLNEIVCHFLKFLTFNVTSKERAAAENLKRIDLVFCNGQDGQDMVSFFSRLLYSNFNVTESSRVAFFFRQIVCKSNLKRNENVDMSDLRMACVIWTWTINAILSECTLLTSMCVTGRVISSFIHSPSLKNISIGMPHLWNWTTIKPCHSISKIIWWTTIFNKSPLPKSTPYLFPHRSP